MSFCVAQAKSASTKLRLPSGSRRCASKPAEMITRSGANASRRGRIAVSIASRKASPPSPDRKGALTIWLCSPRSLKRAGAGIMRHLMGRGVHHGRIVPKDVLDAVAVMDVEIHDRDALGAMRFLRVPGGDGGVVEEAEAHRRRDFGVMAGRAGRDKGVANPAAHHLVDREDRASRGAQRGLERARRHRCVGVERDPAGFGRGLRGSPRYRHADGRARSRNRRRAAQRRAPASETPRPRARVRSPARGRAARDAPRPCCARGRRGAR